MIVMFIGMVRMVIGFDPSNTEPGMQTLVQITLVGVQNFAWRSAWKRVWNTFIPSYILK